MKTNTMKAAATANSIELKNEKLAENVVGFAFDWGGLWDSLTLPSSK